MNKWKWAFFICLTLLILSNLFLLQSLIDQGISYGYLKVSYDDQIQANNVLGNLIVKGGKNYTQKDILHLLRKAYPDEFIVDDGNKISMGPNQFEFKDNKLVSVR